MRKKREFPAISGEKKNNNKIIRQIRERETGVSSLTGKDLKTAGSVGVLKI